MKKRVAFHFELLALSVLFFEENACRLCLYGIRFNNIRKQMCVASFYLTHHVLCHQIDASERQSPFFIFFFVSGTRYLISNEMPNKNTHKFNHRVCVFMCVSWHAIYSILSRKNNSTHKIGENEKKVNKKRNVQHSRL